MIESPHSRKQGKAQPWIVVLIAVLCLAGLIFILKGNGFSKLESFPVRSYLDEPGDFLGNEYILKAQIDNQLKWSRGVGRLVSVVPDGGDVRLPVFIPDAIAQNIQSGQRYELRIQIEEGGLIHVEDLRKY